MKPKRPPKLKALIRILSGDGITIMECGPATEEHYARHGCWTLTLADPVHNHHLNQCFYDRYVEQAELKLFYMMNKPGGAHGAVVVLVVGPFFT